MEEQVSIANNYNSDTIRFNIIFPTNIFNRDKEYNFYLNITSCKYIPRGWCIDLCTNPDISKIINIRELSKEYPIRFSHIDNYGLIRLISLPYIRPKKISPFILVITLKIKTDANIGINHIIKKGIINYIEPGELINNILDEYNYEKRVVLGELIDRVIVENKFVRIL